MTSILKIYKIIIIVLIFILNIIYLIKGVPFNIIFNNIITSPHRINCNDVDIEPTNTYAVVIKHISVDHYDVESYIKEYNKLNETYDINDEEDYSKLTKVLKHNVTYSSEIILKYKSLPYCVHYCKIITPIKKTKNDIKNYIDYHYPLNTVINVTCNSKGCMTFYMYKCNNINIIDDEYIQIYKQEL